MAQVTVSEGVLEGEFVKHAYGAEYFSFKGIPYATPPVGELRFKAPQPSKPWKGVRKATEFGPICFQFDILTNKILANGSEDCLYLNVYTPQIKPKKLLPVMFWIHGGGFISGSGNDDLYGPQFLIRKDVVVITINYRLEVLGFLSLETEDVPGNAGMKDQVAALRWVKKNIKNFGGDPENITIFGESAGGASVGFHMISPMTKGLFNRAIPASGSSNCYWSRQRTPRVRAEALAKKLGCNSNNDKELYEFFKSQPVEKLAMHQVHITYAEAGSANWNMYFSIVDEKQFGDSERFFYGDVNEILRNQGIHEGVEVLTGYTKDEGVISLIGVSNIEQLLNEANTFYQFYVPPTIVLNTKIEEQFEIGKQFKGRLIGNNVVTKDDILSICRFNGMDGFKLPLIAFAKTIARKNKVFLYNFKCFSYERNLFTAVSGINALIGFKEVVSHADDLFYLFHSTQVKEPEVNTEAYKMIDLVTTLWTNFAKYGNPTPEGFEVKWTPFSIEKQNFVEITNTIIPRQYPEKDDVEFWENMYNKYCPEYVQYMVKNKI